MDNIVGKWMRQTGRILILLLCMMACVSCASGQDAQVEQAGMPDLSAEEGSSAGSQTPGETGSRTPGEESGEEKAPDEERAAEKRKSRKSNRNRLRSCSSGLRRMGFFRTATGRSRG